MSLYSSILEQSGDCASLEEVLRYCSLFFRKFNKTLMDRSDVYSAVKILFSGEKFRTAHHLMQNHYNDILSKPLPPTNFDQNKRKIKSILARYGNFKLSDNFVYFLDGIYENIPDYTETDLQFKSQYNASEIILKSIYVTGNCRLVRVRGIHYDLLMEVLSPNCEMEIIWDIAKTKEGISQLQKVTLTRGYKFSKDFYDKLGIKN